MKSIKTSAVLFFILLSTGLSAQNLIGYKAKEIRTYMKENQKSMIYRSMIYNNTFKYLKYENKAETQTILFFLTADSVCKSIRLVYDQGLKVQQVKELDSQYKRSGVNIWTDTREGEKYIIELKDEEWSFNVTIRLNE